MDNLHNIKDRFISHTSKGEFLARTLKDRFNTWRYNHIKPSKNESSKVTDEDLESALKTDSSEYFAEEKTDDGYIYDRAIGYNRKYLGFCMQPQYACRGTPAPGRSAARTARWSARPHRKSPWTLSCGCPAVPVHPASASPVPIGILRFQQRLFTSASEWRQ